MRWSSEARRGALAAVLVGVLLADLALAGWVGWRWVQGPGPVEGPGPGPVEGPGPVKGPVKGPGPGAGEAGARNPPASDTRTVLMTREEGRRIQSEHQIWEISRESWVLDGALLEYRLWVASVRWRAREDAAAMNRLSQWALYNEALRALPEARPEGVTAQKIDRVALHLPATPEDQWVRMEVKIGLCSFPGSPPEGVGQD